MEENAAMEFRDYGFQFEQAEQPTLEHIDFVLNYGELVVLAGASGVGKSTLLFSANGVIPNFTLGTQSGDILIDGKSILGEKTSWIARRIGSVLQNADTQIVHEVVEDEIAFACENLCYSTEEIRSRIEFGCRLMELSPQAHTRVLSGGQKQRLITATSLAMGQKILLLDEPLANLDVEGAHRLMRTLKQLAQKECYAILVVEHRLDMVIAYSDRVLWMEDGCLRQLEKGERPDQSVRLKAASAAAAPGACLLKAKDLHYQASGKEILKGIDFSICERERIVILGENGCGKTTLLRLLSGLVKPSGGSVESPLLPVSRKGKKRFTAAWFQQTGVVEQNPNYQLFMPSVRQEILYQAESEAWAEWLLEALSLKKFKEQHPQSLSEGQKRRVSIAAILAMKPRLLLMDEPTVGQDLQSLQCLLTVLQTMQQMTKVAQVVVTHDRRFAEAFADRVIWMKEGRIYRTGTKSLCQEYFQSLQQII